MNETDGIAGTGEVPKVAEEVRADEVRELNIFSKDYSITGFDFRPQPVGSEVPEPDAAPKGLSAAASADFSQGTIHDAPTEVPSLSEPPVETATAEKDSGLPKAPVVSTPTS